LDTGTFSTTEFDDGGVFGINLSPNNMSRKSEYEQAAG
jgi:hypothetical protein